MWDLQPKGASHVPGPRQTMYAWARKRGAYRVPCGHRLGSHGPSLDIQGFPILKDDYSRYRNVPLPYPRTVDIMPHNISVNIVRHRQPSRQLFRPRSVQSPNIERQRQNTARTSYSEGLPPLTSAKQRQQLGEEPPSACWYHNAVEQEYFRMRSVLSAGSDHNGRTKDSNRGNQSRRIIKPATFLLEQPSDHDATTQAHSQVIDDRVSPEADGSTDISYNLITDSASYNNDMTSAQTSDAIDSELADLMEQSSCQTDKPSRPATPTEMVLRENDPSLHDVEAVAEESIDNYVINVPAETNEDGACDDLNSVDEKSSSAKNPSSEFEQSEGENPTVPPDSDLSYKPDSETELENGEGGSVIIVEVSRKSDQDVDNAGDVRRATDPNEKEQNEEEKEIKEDRREEMTIKEKYQINEKEDEIGLEEKEGETEEIEEKEMAQVEENGKEERQETIEGIYDEKVGEEERKQDKNIEEN